LMKKTDGRKSRVTVPLSRHVRTYVEPGLYCMLIGEHH
jgi:hypothetical protein